MEHFLFLSCPGRILRSLHSFGNSQKYTNVKLSLLIPRIASDIVELLFYEDDRILNNLSSYENSIFHCTKFYWFWHFLSQWLWDEICVTTEDRKRWNIGIRISFICVAELNNLYKFSAFSWWLIKTDKKICFKENTWNTGNVNCQ